MNKNEHDIKYCNVRMANNLHKKAKIEAIRQNMSLQDWINQIVFQALNATVYSKNEVE